MGRQTDDAFQDHSPKVFTGPFAVKVGFGVDLGRSPLATAQHVFVSDLDWAAEGTPAIEMSGRQATVSSTMVRR